MFSIYGLIFAVLLVRPPERPLIALWSSPLLRPCHLSPVTARGSPRALELQSLPSWASSTRHPSGLLRTQIYSGVLQGHLRPLCDRGPVPPTPLLSFLKSPRSFLPPRLALPGPGCAFHWDTFSALFSLCSHPSTSKLPFSFEITSELFSAFFLDGIHGSASEIL